MCETIFSRLKFSWHVQWRATLRKIRQEETLLVMICKAKNLFSRNVFFYNLTFELVPNRMTFWKHVQEQEFSVKGMNNLWNDANLTATPRFETVEYTWFLKLHIDKICVYRSKHFRDKWYHVPKNMPFRTSTFSNWPSFDHTKLPNFDN